MSRLGQEAWLLDVAWATTELLAVPAPAVLLDVDSAEAALVCRDALVRELRVVLRGVLGVGTAAPDPDAAVPVRSAVRGLHVALAALPLVGADGPGLRQVLQPRDSVFLSTWQEVARAAIALERHVSGWSRVDANAAAEVIRGVAALVRVLLDLDGQLGRQLPTGFRLQRMRLCEQRRHRQAAAASAAILSA